MKSEKPLRAHDVMPPTGMGIGMLGKTPKIESGPSVNEKPSNPKDSIGFTKPPISVIPTRVIAEVGLGMLEGSCKYGRHNYREAGVRASIYYDAAQRHLNKWWEGEDIDPDSGLSHIVKAIASLFVLRDGMLEGNYNDDRPPAIDPGFWVDLELKTAEILARFNRPVAPFTQKGKIDAE